MSQRIRILQLITSLAGGAGLNAYQLARHLDPQLFEVDLAYGPGYPLDQQVIADQLPHHLLRWPRQLNPIATSLGTLDVIKLLKQKQYDIVHVHCSLAGLIGRVAARWLGVSTIVFTVHAFASRPHQPHWKQKLLLKIERGLDRYTDHYCVSTKIFQKALVEKHIAPSKAISLIPLGIELRTSRLTRQEARAKLNLPTDHPVIISAGRFEKQKGFRYLIEAMPTILRAVPNTTLVLLGDGPLRNELEAQAHRLGVTDFVNFAGWRTDAPELLPAADVFSLPSLWEAFGYVLLEAMAAGIPIAASNVDGIPEVLDQGRLGELHPAQNSDALAKALIRLLTDTEHSAQLSRSGREHVLAHHSLDTMIHQYQDLYQSLSIGKAN